MATPPTTPRDSRFGNITGIDLLAPVELNPNPFDIKPTTTQPQSSVWEKWLYFWGFANKYLDKTDVSINTEEGKRKITSKLIEDFNSNKDISDWAKFGNSSPNRGTNNPITREDIFAIQRFTQKVDPRVVIDGWVGTQTLQMLYPKILTITFRNAEKTPNPQNYYPVIWGDKRFVITVKNNTEHENTNNKSRASFLIPYDPAKHDGKFEENTDNNKRWKALGQTAIITASAEKVNSETAKQSVNKNILQSQTKISKSL